jgi:hypothetical protein
MTSESPSTPTNTGTNGNNTGKNPAPACDEYWSPFDIMYSDCPRDTSEDSERTPRLIGEHKNADGTYVRT